VSGCRCWPCANEDGHCQKLLPAEPDTHEGVMSRAYKSTPERERDRQRGREEMDPF
jgi:hypothetical protein